MYLYFGMIDTGKGGTLVLELNEKQKIQSETLKITIIKRDGRKTAFDLSKIRQAIIKAAKSVQKNLSPIDYQNIENVVDDVEAEIKARFQKDVKIYEIQNIVEHTLLAHHQYEIAQAYISYRTQKDFARNQAVA